MPVNRKGMEQVCPKCKGEGFKEVYDPSYNYDEEQDWLKFSAGLAKYHRDTGIFS
jgi:hypothetical protein